MELLTILVFVIGYLLITLEHNIHIDKAATAIITGVLCWTLYSLSGVETHHLSEHLGHHLSDIAGILFFLIGAMTIVELIDAHQGFEVITQQIRTRDKRRLLWVIGILTFFLSAILDNLTTTSVIVVYSKNSLQIPKIACTTSRPPSLRPMRVGPGRPSGMSRPPCFGLAGSYQQAISWSS